MAWLSKTEYAQYLKTEHWREFAFQQKKRCNWKCEKCRRFFRQLDVHHTTYERMPYNELPDDVEVLCRNCHQDRHGIVERVPTDAELTAWFNKL